MRDLIDRYEAIKAIKRSISGDTYEVDKAIEAVEQLPSTMPEWIFCDEKLPKDKQEVIGWFSGRIDIVRFEQGISEETREKMKNGELDDPVSNVWSRSTGTQKATRSSLFSRCDEWGNNKKPYCWVHEPMVYFGQDCLAWMPITLTAPCKMNKALP